jgi:phosphohistidine phosphatase SixA
MSASAPGELSDHRIIVVIRHAHAADGRADIADRTAGHSAGDVATADLATGDHATGDHARPLDERGRRDATAAGKWLAADGRRFDLVLVSSAVRARQTWELISAELADPPEPRFEALIYDSSPDDLVDLLTEDRARLPVVAVVGHNPAVSELAWFLAGRDGARLQPAEIAIVEAGTDGGICPGRFVHGFTPGG